jgi:hypothetical protein
MNTAPNAKDTNRVKNKEEALALYNKLAETSEPSIAVQAVAEAIIDGVKSQSTPAPIQRQLFHALSLGNDIFIAFAKLLFETKQVYVSKHYLMGHVKVRYPIIFNFLLTNKFKPARDYEKSEGR